MIGNIPANTPLFIDNPQNTFLGQGRITNTYELFSNATKIAPLGWIRHTVKFGYSGRREETRRGR